MATPPAAEIVLLGLYPAALCAAIGTDLARRVIPNLLVAVLIAGFVTLWAVAPLPDLSVRLLIAGAVTALGFSLFAENVVGAGDVKLAGVLMLWLDPLQVPLFVMATGLIGAALALAAMMRRRAGTRQTLPYGVALAGAGLLLLPFSELMQAA